MSVVDDIAAIRARLDLSEDEQRPLIYAVKTAALMRVVERMLGRNIKHNDYRFSINAARVTPQPALWLDVTFTKAGQPPVTHQITIVNPPVLPRIRTGNERRDLKQAIHEMLEGFV